MSRSRIIVLPLSLVLFFGCAKSSSSKKLRLGYFPNLTHAQVLIGIANGKFQEILGPGIEIESKAFNAGPSAVEALFAGAIDITYIGPSPAINAYIKSGGLFKIIAGSASGGAALIVRKDSGIRSSKDLYGKKIATPQMGNTQDVSARAWLRNNGFILKEKGGTVQIVPVSNPDQITLFLKKEIDAAWTVEPWATRLIHEADGKIFLNEREVWKTITGGAFATTVILIGEKYLKENPDLIKKWIQAHLELTEWIRSNPSESKSILNNEIKKLTGKTLPEKVLNDAFAGIEFTVDPVRKSILQQSQWAFEEGFLGSKKPDLLNICDLSILNEVLKEKKMHPVE